MFKQLLLLLVSTGNITPAPSFFWHSLNPVFPVVSQVEIEDDAPSLRENTKELDVKDVNYMLNVLEPDSPLIGLEEELLVLCEEHDLDPLFFLALSYTETDLGLYPDTEHNFINGGKKTRTPLYGLADNVETVSQNLLSYDLDVLKEDPLFNSVWRYPEWEEDNPEASHSRGFVISVPDDILMRDAGGVIEVDLPEQMLDGFIIEPPTWD